MIPRKHVAVVVTMLSVFFSLSGRVEAAIAPTQQASAEVTAVRVLLSDSDSTKVYFAYGSSSVEGLIGANAEAMDEIAEEIRQAYASGKLTKVIIDAWGCPIGNYDKIIRLVRKRADNFRTWILSSTGLPEEMVETGLTDISWGCLDEFVKADTRLGEQEKQAVMEILEGDVDAVVNNDGTHMSRKRAQLMAVNSGQTYWYLREKYFPRMRYIDVTIEEKSLRTTHTFETTEEGSVTGHEVRVATFAVARTDSTAVTPVSADTLAFAGETSAESAYLPENQQITPPRSADLTQEDGPKVLLKTNIPFWALVVPNLAVETRLSDHWSLDIPLFYCPYTVARTYRFRTLTLQPSVRYWLRPDMTGHFFGAHLTAGMFNVSVDEKSRYQDTSGAWGAGLDYGYALSFSERWGMEFNIGVGYIWSNYDTYYNIENGIDYANANLNYFGLTRLGISLIYKF